MHQFFRTACSQGFYGQSITCLRTPVIAIILTLLLGMSHFCQGSTEIRGKVIDRDTGQPILGAAVKIGLDGLVLEQTTTGRDGSFHLTQDAQGKKQIQVSSTGYKHHSEMLALTPDSIHNLKISLYRYLTCAKRFVVEEKLSLLRFTI